MGQRGRMPTPSAVLKARGTYRKDRRMGGAEVEAPLEKPACPGWLSDEGKAEWRRTVGQLYRLRCVAKIDRAMLAVYCEAWADFVRATCLIELAWRALAEAPAGSEAALALALGEHPLAAFRDRAAARFIKIADRFGLSPSARTRVRAVAAPAEEGPPQLYKIRD